MSIRIYIYIYICSRTSNGCPQNFVVYCYVVRINVCLMRLIAVMFRLAVLRVISAQARAYDDRA